MIDENMFRFIWRYSRRDQLLILAIVLLSLPFYFLALDLPKTIVNKAIQGQGFEDSPVQSAFEVTLPGAQFLWGEPVTLFSGFELERIPFLVCMSLTFLVLVIVNGLFKLSINTAKGRLGERMLRRLRFMLFECILRFPPEHFRTVKTPELATMIKDEVEPLGGFIGDAYVQPVFLGGQVITALTFIFVQNFWLGAVAGVIALTQAILVPKLRAPILALGRLRQLTARTLAGRIGDSADGIAEIHVNDTSGYERAAIGELLGRIFSIRFRLYQKKFLVKFINNLLAQFTPFLFFLVGGYFAIVGQLDVGQLVAVIVAYKELPGPMKELIDWDQRRLDGAIKYEQVISQFTPDGLRAPSHEGDITDAPLEGPLETVDLTIAAGTGPALDRMSVSVPLDQTVLLTGPGASPFLESVARLRTPTGGSIRFGGQPLPDVPAHVTGRRISYVGETAHLSGGSVFDALAYGLLHNPPGPGADVSVAEARLTGNPVHGTGGDWIDYARAGVETRDALRAEMLDVLRVVELDTELYAWGLRRPVEAQVNRDRLMRARRLVAETLDDGRHANLIERFDADAYNSNATIGENLLFGASLTEDFAPDALASSDHTRAVLRECGIENDLVSIGREIGTTMVEIFADLAPDSPLVERFSFVTGEELPQIEAILAQSATGEAGRARLLALAFGYCEVQHRLDLLPAELRDRIVGARRLFRSTLPARFRDAICFYDPDRPTIGALLIDDILFGKISDSVASARKQVESLVHDILREQGLLPVVMEAGLAFPIGNAGRLLSASQRQQIAVARALLRRPDVLLINRALAMTDHEQEGRIVTRILERLAGKAVLAALGGNGSAALFDRHIEFDGARLTSDSLETVLE